MTIGILSWGATKTLINTLDSYNEHGLSAVDDDIIIYFQEMSEKDEIIAKGRGFNYFGAAHNAGIAEGYKRLVERASGDFFLFLENDWLLLRDPATQISQAKYLIESGFADVVRFRDRRDPGNPLWTLQYKGRELEGLTHLLDCVHWVEHPDLFFPEYIRRKSLYRASIEPAKLVTPETIDLTSGVEEDYWYIARAPYANWTNNPHMAKTDFLKENVLPRLDGGDLERDIQNWWQQQDFKVAQGDGLFKHWRIG